MPLPNPPRQSPQFLTEVANTPPTGSSAIVSVALHAIAIAVLALATGPAAEIVGERRHPILIAPAIPAPQVLRTRIPKMRPPGFVLPPPLAPKQVRWAIDLPEAPRIDPDRPTLIPEVGHSPARLQPSPPPVLQADEFTSTIPAAKPFRDPTLRAANFAAASISGSENNHTAMSPRASGFETSEPAAPVPAHSRIAKSGFTDASSSTDPHVASHAVAKSSFGDAEAETPSARPRSIREPALSSPVEILSKPRPLYTDEARRAGIEGEVLVEVMFQADSTIRVVRLVNGLGHGLDEMALAAAREIRFRPARKDGQPADSSAVLHILFQLAY